MNIKTKQNHVSIEQGQMKQYIAFSAYNLKTKPFLHIIWDVQKTQKRIFC